jgi:hypothetical protein
MSSSQSTLPPQLKTFDSSTLSSILKDTTQPHTTTPIGEKCVNNYCVPFFDEGMLQG